MSGVVDSSDSDAADKGPRELLAGTGPDTTKNDTNDIQAKFWSENVGISGENTCSKYRRSRSAPRVRFKEDAPEIISDGNINEYVSHGLNSGENILTDTNAHPCLDLGAKLPHPEGAVGGGAENFTELAATHADGTLLDEAEKKRARGCDEEIYCSDDEDSDGSESSEVDDAESLTGGKVELGSELDIPKGILKCLLDSGKLGNKPLHAAAAQDDAAQIDVLLGLGGEMHGSVDDPDPFDYTALHVAAEVGSLRALEKLISHGANIEAITKMHCSRPLHYACFEGQAQTCRALIKAGCEIDSRTDDWRTPLFQASFRGHLECVEALLSAGADRDIPARDGKTALEVASTCSIRELLQAPCPKRAKVSM